jgi:hypothetical protein
MNNNADGRYIRAALRMEYQQGSPNEKRVARLQSLMRDLRHRHGFVSFFGAPATCEWCGIEKAAIR